MLDRFQFSSAGKFLTFHMSPALKWGVGGNSPLFNTCVKHIYIYREREGHNKSIDFYLPWGPLY